MRFKCCAITKQLSSLHCTLHYQCTNLVVGTPQISRALPTHPHKLMELITKYASLNQGVHIDGSKGV